jgi:hypothetical protein
MEVTMGMLLKDWLAVPEGKIYPEMFMAGSELTGELLDRASVLGLIADRNSGKAAKHQAEAERQAKEQAEAEEKARLDAEEAARKAAEGQA